MDEFPFQLLIKHTSSKNKEESLSCTALLRVVPGRREVYDALWKDRGVIAKVFSHRISAKRHLKREQSGLEKLARRGLSSPQPLFYGKTEDGRWALIEEKIADSTTALNVFQQTKEPTKKLDLLIALCKELAKQHRKGVLQKDLHLGNFLLASGRSHGLADDKIFLLDAGQMRFLRSEVGKKTGISQLAMLASYLPDSDTKSLEKLYQEYFNCRGWHPDKSDRAIIRKQINAHRKRGINKGLKKCLQTGKRNLRIKVKRYLAVFDKTFYLGAEPPGFDSLRRGELDFVEQIDGLMDKGEILKKGNTCYVSQLKWNGKDIVVKRYNHKGFIHSLRHTIKRSRARRGWLHAHRLRMLQISTPKPLAYIEQRKAGLIWQSYLVTEFVEGQKLYDFLRDSKTSKEEHSVVTQQVVELLDKLGKYRITHGDLKHTNILVTDNGLSITDLDGMKVHKFKWLYRIYRAADVVCMPAIEPE